MASPAADLVAFVAKGIVSHPDEIRVRESDGGRLLELETNPEDRGRVNRPPGPGGEGDARAARGVPTWRAVPARHRRLI